MIASEPGIAIKESIVIEPIAIEESVMIKMVKIIEIAEGKSNAKGEKPESVPIATRLPPVPGLRGHPARAPIITIIRSPIQVNP